MNIKVDSVHRSGTGFQLLQYILFAHILLITGQLLIRATVLDTTYLRDVLLFIVVSIWALNGFIKNKVFRNRPIYAFVGLIIAYLLYGIIVFIVRIFEGINFMDAIYAFRNHFFPFSLFFVARSCFASHDGKTKLINFYYLLCAVMLIGICVESFSFSLGFPKDIFPWYRYQFEKSSRYIGSQSIAEGYILPEDSPVIGILGFPHATSVTIMALVAFILPFLFVYRGVLPKSKPSVWCANMRGWQRNTFFLMGGIGIIILGVKMQMVSFLFVVLVALVAFKRRPGFRQLFFTVCMTGVIILVSASLSSTLLSQYLIGFVGDEHQTATLYSIFDFEIIRELFRFIVGLPLLYLLFGHFYDTSLWFLSGIEVRLLLFTVSFGLIWLMIFACLAVAVLYHCMKATRSKSIRTLEGSFAFGSSLMLIVYLFDMFHYSLLMYFPNIDILAVTLGALSSISYMDKRYDETNLYGIRKKTIPKQISAYHSNICF